MVVIFGTFGVLAFIGLMIFAIAGTPEGNLQKAFAEAGNLSGKTKAEVVAFAGQPNSVSAVAGGKTVLQWLRTSPTGAYHIALLFDANGVCEGITHQHSGRPR